MPKKFYYTAKNYYGATFRETYTRESRRIRIDYTPAGDPFFRHAGRRYKLDDFMRINCMSWEPTEIKAADGETVYICGHEAEVYYKPLFIEIDDAGETVRLYRYEGTETDYN